MDTIESVALAIAAVAAAWDLKTRRLPNVLTFGAALAGVVFHTATAGWNGLGLALAGWVVGAAIFFPVFALGAMGAGDVKLLGALGAWLGPAAVVWVGLYTAIAGGVLALVVAVFAGYLLEALRNVAALVMFWRVVGVRPNPALTLASAKGPRLAYAVPVLFGLMVSLWLQ